ncbi:sigma-E processing peptidase SpoIIGA [Alkalibacillus aidingensis]|uniref:sigma-E processing peptidase SpoIIGA n=1 Tax=Alkalibacillus aidingensis TaxID=2747607 RepID=UPI0016606B32|nr:sigma-E processing peptidase SpoIIGA [Alkalibacillus aidingensis]
MQLYIDLIWLLNFLFDWMILLLVAWVSRYPFSHTRIFLAGLFASLIIPLSFLVSWEGVHSPIFKLIYSIIIIMIGFSYTKWRIFLIRFVSFYFINFAIGGAVFGIHFFLTTNSDMVLINQTSFGDLVSWVVVLTLFPVALYFTKDQLQQLTMFQFKFQKQYDAWIEYRQTNVKVLGFLDTGNQLTHPLTQRPVILVNEKTARNWLDDDLLMRLKNNLNVLEEEQDGLIQFIPYQKAGGQQGMLPVFLADQVTVMQDNQLLTTKKVYVGVHFGEFSKQMEYQCLLNPLLLQSKRMRVKEVKGVS